MKLKDQLRNVTEGINKNAPREVVQNVDAGTEKIIALDVAASSARVGDLVDDFELSNATGEPVRLSEILSTGPAIITFYRGGWCPYCVLELKAYRDLLPELKEAGGNLIAISPELPDNSLTTAEKNELDFAVLSDVGNTVARSLGLTFELPPEHKEVHQALGTPLDKWNGDDSWELPVPGTFLVCEDRRIVWASVRTDYKERAEPSEALSALKTLVGQS